MYFQTLCVNSKGSGETADAQACECFSLGRLHFVISTRF